MIVIQGTGVSNGIAKGPLYVLRRPNIKVIKAPGHPDTEKQRLASAQETARQQLESLAGKLRDTARDAADLFDTHAMLVVDEDLTDFIRSMIETECCCAEYAVQQSGVRFSAMFAEMDDPYMQARAADITDVTRRILHVLMGHPPDEPFPDTPVILCTDDLTPSETVQLDRTKILGIVTRGGSKTSHTAILARTMGIPAICGARDALQKDYTGQLCCLDGTGGKLFVDPGPDILATTEEHLARQQTEELALQAMIGLEDITLDGRRLQLCCNIASPEDVPAVLANDGQGIGLFRSEFLYLEAEDFPDEETQFKAYRAVASAMGGKRVVIRTMDIGADKQPPYFATRQEENPALGMRGIRLCLKRPDLFRAQLRAIYRASSFGKVAVMFPMISSVWEVRACKDICRTVMAELDAQGVPYDRDMETGIMIETPAAVLLAHELAGEVDFFSVGTNDLTQYTLACDRQANDMEAFFDPHHPAVLRGIQIAADAAHAAGIRVCICGDLGADQELLPTFLALGIDELSVPSTAVLPLRAAIRNSTVNACATTKAEC